MGGDVGRFDDDLNPPATKGGKGRKRGLNNRRLTKINYATKYHVENQRYREGQMACVGKTVAVTLLAMSMCGCATIPEVKPTEVTSLQTAFSTSIESVADAETVSATLMAHYVGGADEARRQRRMTNTFILAANTYTLGALSLGYHAHNAIVSALAANYAMGSEGVRNAGGEEAWLSALTQTTCITGKLGPAALLETYPEALWSQDLKLAYDETLRAARAGFMVAYLNYRRASTQAVLKAESIPAKGGGAKARSQGKVFQPGEQAALLTQIQTAKTAIERCVAPAT